MAELAWQTVGAGRDLVLLHPIGLDASCWSKLAVRLQQTYRLHLFDLPGHGKSAPIAGTPALEDYADRVMAMIERLRLDDYWVAGLSFGGMIAQEIGIKRPAGLAGLILCGCGCTFPEQVRPAIRERGERALAGGMAAVLHETLDRWFSPEFLASGDIEPIRERLLANDPRNWAAAWNAIAALDTRSRLAGIEVQTLCVAGGKDLGAPPAAVRAVTDGIRGARYVEIPEATHMMQWETPVLLSDALSHFPETGS